MARFVAASTTGLDRNKRKQLRSRAVSDLADTDSSYRRLLEHELLKFPSHNDIVFDQNLDLLMMDG
jgi:hypothetical protein